MKTAYDIVIRPIITEQSMEDLDIKKYAFEVAKDANKIEIKKAVEEIFGVTVIKVTTTNVRGKEKRSGAYPVGCRVETQWTPRHTHPNGCQDIYHL